VRIYFCKICSNAFQVGGYLDEIKGLLTEGMYTCITPGCQGVMHKTGNVPMGTPMHEVPLTVFYRAIHGFGSPNGECATVTDFVDLLKTQAIVQVLAEKAGQPERVILKTLVLANGVRMHFDSSSKGACCYYIEQPGPTCLEVVDDEIRAQTAALCSDQNREEVRRASDLGDEGRDEARDAASDGAALEQSRPGMSAVSEPGEVPSGTTTRPNECNSDH